ncbi:MAG: immunoglobulin domain-containing protein [Lacunisphaera sp.]
MNFFQKRFFQLVAGVLFFTGLGLAHADQVAAGSKVVLSVSADGTAPFTYQWIKDGSSLSGSTSSTLTLSNVQSANAGSYAVTVANAAGSTTSPVSTITIALPPVITTQPVSQSVAVGAAVTFTAVASGTPIPTYQWKENGVSISGATNASLTLTNVQTSAAATYSVVATNSIGSATSVGAVLKVSGQTQTNVVAFGATTFPATAYPGETISFTYTVTNAGTKAWGANHYLGLRDSNQTNLSFASLSGVAVGGSTKVDLSFIAPSIPGTYTYYVQGLENGVAWFNRTALTLTVAPSNAMGYNTTTFPHTVTAGTKVNFSYNVTNTGGKAWGANHYLGLRDTNLNNLVFTSLNGVAPGVSATYNLSFVAPMTPGTYTYYVQGLENGVEWFSTRATLTLIVPITPLANAMKYNTTNFPVSVAGDSTVSFTYNVTNTGTKVWGANHYLALRDEDFNNLSFASVSGVAPGGSTTQTLSFKAPIIPGTYTYYVEGLENGVEWFSTTATLTLTVLPDNAMTFNATTFPAQAARGATVTFTYNVTNTGAQAWGANHYLGLRDANLTNLRFASLGGVAVGASTTASLTFIAPSTPGTYTYYIQGLENGVEWFEESTVLTLVVP